MKIGLATYNLKSNDIDEIKNILYNSIIEAVENDIELLCFGYRFLKLDSEKPNGRDKFEILSLIIDIFNSDSLVNIDVKPIIALGYDENAGVPYIIENMIVERFLELKNGIIDSKIAYDLYSNNIKREVYSSYMLIDLNNYDYYNQIINIIDYSNENLGIGLNPLEYYNKTGRIISDKYNFTIEGNYDDYSILLTENTDEASINKIIKTDTPVFIIDKNDNGYNAFIIKNKIIEVELYSENSILIYEI